MKLLVIEDEPTDQKLEYVVMGAAGYNVSTSGSAEEALEIIKENKPRVILLDLHLPGMSGLEFARRLKAGKETKDIIIVAVTGHPSLFSKKNVLDAGCRAYVLKPIDTRKLPEQIAMLLAEQAK